MIKRGYVWWVEFNRAIGQEIHKTRPAIIVSNDRSNDYLARFQVVPLSTKTHRVYPGEVLITLLDKTHKAMANQLDTASIERFKKPIGVLSVSDMLAIEEALKIQLGLF